VLGLFLAMAFAAGLSGCGTTADGAYRPVVKEEQSDYGTSSHGPVHIHLAGP
jgi:hypothetical protein